MINDLILSPENIPVLSKQNAATFHRQVKERIFETGTGLFEYVEAVKFFDALDKQVNYPPTAEPMGWASWVNAPTNVGN